jgi:DNA-binding transcriptional LysR family regulator
MEVPHRSPITIQRLRLLVALADAGTVTAAARAAGVSQPALSQNLRAIERHYGFPLLMRAGRRVVLTKPARAVVDYARRILRLAEESERAVRDLMEMKAGALALAASPTPATYLLPGVLAQFRTRHPDIELKLRVGDAHAVERWVLAGEADVGVIGEASGCHGVLVTPFRRDELVVVASPAHPLASAARLDAEALAAHPLVVRERGSGTREALERAIARSGFTLKVLFELESTEAILQLVAAGLGATVVSELAVAEPTLGRRLKVRRVAGLDLSRYLAVVTHVDTQPGPAAREFVASLTRGAGPRTVPAA